MDLKAAREFAKTPLGDAVLAGVIAAVLALPLLGFRLTDSAQGAGIEFRPLYLLIPAVAVFLGRLSLNYLKNCHGPLSLPSGRAFARTRGRATQAIVGLFRRPSTSEPASDAPTHFDLPAPSNKDRGSPTL